MTKFSKGLHALPSVPTRMYLVDDDVIEVKARLRGQCAFRIRVWRSKGFPPLVLVSQMPGGTPPNWATCKLANKAYSAYLHYPLAGMVYLEAYQVDGSPRLVSYSFEYVGVYERAKAIKAFGAEIPWGQLCDMTGELVSL